jgi:hypothetical protein
MYHNSTVASARRSNFGESLKHSFLSTACLKGKLLRDGSVSVYVAELIVLGIGITWGMRKQNGLARSQVRNHSLHLSLSGRSGPNWRG